MRGDTRGSALAAPKALSAWPSGVPGEAPTVAGLERLLLIAEAEALPTPTAATPAAPAEPRATRSQPEGPRLLMPLYATLGMRAMLKNLLCSVERLDVRVGRLVIAMDAPTPRALSTCGVVRASWGAHRPIACEAPYAAVPRPGSSSGGNGGSSGGNGGGKSSGSDDDAGGGELGAASAAPSRYLSREFNAIMIHRVAWTSLLLGRGLSILHCDLDIVWLHDPLPHFASAPLERADMLIMSEQGYGNNGGFYLMRHSNRTLAFLHAWLRQLTLHWSVKGFEEQHALNEVLRWARKRRHGLELLEPSVTFDEPLHDLP